MELPDVSSANLPPFRIECFSLVSGCPRGAKTTRHDGIGSAQWNWQGLALPKDCRNMCIWGLPPFTSKQTPQFNCARPLSVNIHYRETAQPIRFLTFPFRSLLCLAAISIQDFPAHFDPKYAFLYTCCYILLSKYNVTRCGEL